jgi:hypothetical protein
MMDDDSLQDSQRGVPGNIQIPQEDATVATAGVLSPSMAGDTQVRTSASVLASLTSVIDQHITNVESAEMSSFLGELCNVLGN